MSIADGTVYRIAGPNLAPGLGFASLVLLALLLGGGATIALGTKARHRMAEGSSG